MDLLALFKEKLLSQNLPALSVRQAGGRQEKPLAKVTVKNYLSDIRRFFEWFETTYQTPVNPHALSQKVLSTFLAHLAQEKKLERLSQPSIDRLISSLRKFFTFLKDEGLTDNNPFIPTSHAQKEKDVWRLREFKDSLYVSNFTGVSIKNYIIDIQAFKVWYEKTIGEENGLSITPAILEVYKDRLLNILHLAPRSINRKLSSIRKYAEFLDKDASLFGDSVSNVVLMQEPESTSLALEDLRNKEEVKKSSFYSKLAPVRFILAIAGVYTIAEDFIACKIAERLSGAKFLQLNSPHKTLFTLFKKGFSTSPTESVVKNIKKEFYAPHLISLSGLPFYKKVLHHMRYTRPYWYKRYHSNAFTHYLHVSILIIFSVSIGYILYQNLIAEPGKKSELFAAPAQPLKVYSFQGRLTDASDNPITTHKQVRFILYDNITASGAARLWEEVRSIDPDQDGIFSILLASDPATGGNAALCNGGSPPASPATDACGIPQSLFRDNAQLFLGISIGNDSELTPRQQLATVAYATNAEVLQGLPPITQAGAASTNVVLALDSSGNLTIANSASPTFQASGGQFKLMGQPLVLATNASSNGNIQLAPDNLGKIDLQKPLINDGASGNLVPGGVEVNDKFGVLATESAVAAFTINNNTAGGDIFTASSSATPRFTIGNLGTITANAYTNNGGIIYAQTSGALAQSTVGVLGQCLQSIGGGAPTWGTCGSSSGSSNWTLSTANGTLSPNNNTLDFLLGGIATTSAKFGFLNVNGSTSPVASISATTASGGNGNGIVIGGDGTIQSLRNNTLTLGGATTGNILFKPLNDFGTVAIGKSLAPINSALGDPKFQVFSNLGTSPVASFSGKTSAASLIVNNDGVGDIFTASSGGTTAFRIKNNGDIVVGSAGEGKITAAVIDPYLVQNQKTSGTVSLTFQTMAAANGDFVYQNQSTELAKLMQAGQFQLPITGATGGILLGGDVQIFRGAADRIDMASGDSLNLVSGSILTGGTTRIDSSGNGTFNDFVVNGTCAGCVSSTDSPFQVLSGAIVPRNSTHDFLIGGQATTSAKFAVLNINSGTPVASIAGNFSLGSAAGTTRTIGATAMNTLQIGDANTGDLVLAPANTTAMTIKNGGNVGIGTTNPVGKLDILTGNSATLGDYALIETSGSTAYRGGLLLSNATSADTATYFKLTSTFNGAGNGGATARLGFIKGNATETFLNSGAGLEFQYDGDVVLAQGTGNIGIGSTGPDQKLDVLSGGGGTQLRLTSTDGSVYTDFKTDQIGDLTITPSGADATISGRLTVSGGNTGGLSALTVNQTGASTNDIFTASASGLTKFTISNTGALTSAAYTNAGGLLYTATTGLIGQTAIGTNTQCLIGGTTPSFGSCATGTADFFWQQSGGLLYPNNTTVDFAIGGTSTASADFAVLNVNGTGPVTATVSGNLIVMPTNGAGGNVGIGTTAPGYLLDIQADRDNYINVVSTTGLNQSTGIKFQRGTISDVYTDYTVYDQSGGIFTIDESTSGVTSTDFVINGKHFGLGTSRATSLAQIATSITDSTTATTAINTATEYLHLGGQEYNTNSYRLIGFGYQVVANTYSPAYIGYQEMNTGAQTYGDLIFGTRSVTSDTLPTERMRIDNLGNIGMGTVTPLSELHVTRPLSFGANGKALAIFDQIENQDIFTASASGTPIFSITYAGGIKLGTDVGTSGTCITGGATAAWGTCGGGGSNWTLSTANGTLSPNNNTLDFLLGGIATTSAKFAVLNVNGTGPVTATISGNLIVMPTNGAGGNVGIGTTNPRAQLEINGTAPAIYLSESDGSITALGRKAGNDTASLILGNNGQNDIRFGNYSAGGWGRIYVNNTYNYTSDSDGILAMSFSTTGNVGIGTSAPSSSLHVTRPLLYGATGKALAIFDQIENQDIFTASAAGVPKFSVTNAGGIKLGTSVGTNVQCITGGATAAWGTCGSGGGSNWTLSTANGTLSPNNNTLDFLWGSTATNSARFHLYGNVDAGTNPTASISGTTSTPTLLVTNDGSGDLIVASASGQTMFRLTNAGNLLLPAGSKITGPTLYDPLYDIDGTGYSTFLPAMPGVKEEVAGRINTSYNSTLRAYAQIINLDNQPIGSDLWVFSRTIDRDISLISALLTPESSARTWYVKDPTTRSLIVYSDRPTEVSYRFTAPRFDHKKYPTNVNNEEPAEFRYHTPAMPDNINIGPVQVTEDTYWTTLNIILNNEAWSIVDSLNNEFIRVEAFSQAKIAELTAGLINAQKVTTQSLAIATNSVTIAGQSLQGYITGIVNDTLITYNLQPRTYISPLASIDQIHTNIISPLADSQDVAIKGNINVKDANDNTVARIDTQGNASISGKLSSDSVQTNSATISGTLAANNVQTNSIQTNDATVSGTLHAGKIIADDIEGLNARIATLAANTVISNTYYVSSESANLATNTLNTNYQIPALPAGGLNTKFIDIENISAGFGTFRDGLIALGPATFNQITAIDSLSIGTNLTIGSNSINLLGEDLQIQPLKQGGVSFLAGLVHIDTQGNLAVGGNADFAKDVTVHGKLAANIISPLPNQDLNLRLTSQGEALQGRLNVENASGSAVLSINNQGDLTASGSGTFNKLNFALVAPAYALDDTTAIATSSAGTATLKQFKRELTIQNPNVTDKSLIYITPVGDTNNQVLYLLRQTPASPAGGPNTEVENGSFTVGVSTPAAKDVNFNWMIVN